MPDNTQSSSARAMTESAAGSVRKGIANLTGNPHDHAAAEDKNSMFRFNPSLTH